MMIYYSGKK